MANAEANIQDRSDLKVGEKHPYHLVNPSPWPMLASLAAGATAMGGVLYMHDKGALFLILAFVALNIIAFLWWRDVIKEAVVEKAHSKIVKIGLRYGMSMFIASEVMFFAAFFWAFFDASLLADHPLQFDRLLYTQGSWPPPQIEAIDAFHLPLYMTLILLLSGTTVTWAHAAILENKRKDATTALALTVLLGIIFSAVQMYEYGHTAFAFAFNPETLDGGVFASTFYMATGFHGFHVVVGTIFLAVCLYRNMKGHFTADSHFGFEAAAWYWHFVDVVWLFLFISIYWWGGA